MSTNLNTGILMENPIHPVIQLQKDSPILAENFVHHHKIPAKPAVFASIPENMDNRLKTILTKSGFSHLYQHQVMAWEEISKGNHAIITTGTASGKTFCFLLPILNQILKNPDVTTLLIYPTKALGRDQFNTIKQLTKALSEIDPTINIRTAVYDGDTPTRHRTTIRNNVNLLITNPDMLHLGILPFHIQWDRFFENLHYIVIDEAHTYRGVFGSHVSNLLRRINRIQKYYQSSSVKILSSATISNASEFGSKLTGDNVVVIDQNSSYQVEKEFVFYNPPLVNKELGIRAGMIPEVIKLIFDILENNLQTITFSRSRRSVEVLYRQAIDAYPNYSHVISSYRSGYLPMTRRSIENDLKTGKLKLVFSTNALELGIDYGKVNVVVIAGYPGTIAETFQQAGRAGRKNQAALIYIVASSDPIDQFIINNPEYLFERPVENCLIDPDNIMIMLQHLRCAAYELPFSKVYEYGPYKDQLEELLDLLMENNLILEKDKGYYWIGDDLPSGEISIRSSSQNRIALYVTLPEEDKLLGEIDYESALWMVHPGAVYIHEGETYLCKSIDFESGTAVLEHFPNKYFTVAQKKQEITTLETISENEFNSFRSRFETIKVITQIASYKKIDWDTRATIDIESLSMPETELITKGFRFCFKNDFVEKLFQMGISLQSRIDYGDNWEIQRKRALKRDQYTCQHCGTFQKSNEVLHVHHKKPFRLFPNYMEANHLNNLVTLCPACHKQAEKNVKIRHTLSGMRYAMRHISPFLLMCAVNDLGEYLDPVSSRDDEFGSILIYDQFQGGIGLSENLYRNPVTLIETIYKHVVKCSCLQGCPACIGAAGENGFGAKSEVIIMLKEILKSE